ncbi:MMPL family transporter [Marinicrinis sediminis]|uniref:MMPL family transporter n=1 Tax=Marinicrinis sediminis TaxID=1652465 RepID=A0ABW5R6A1_9BACL
MKTILKFKWLILVLWIAAAVGLTIQAPSMETLVREKGQVGVPDGYSSSLAEDFLKEMNGEATEASGTSDASDSDAMSEMQAVLVFHNENGLQPEDYQAIGEGLSALMQTESSSPTYGITKLVAPLGEPQLEEQMISPDGTTMLTLLSVADLDRTNAEIRDDLYKAVQDIPVDHYYTGSWLIDEDVIESSQEGLKKTEYITVVFILLILFVVFRSAIAPFIPLLTVGISYITAQSVVAFLVDGIDFPLSNFTQIFMVAVMFGIGTDYCILLISRFKEELAKGDKIQAIVTTYRTAGKTVLFSGIAVMIGFASIGFSTFSLYKSAVAVAVGVAFLMLALVTIVPFFMAVLGKSIFWPVNRNLDHGHSKLWEWAGKSSLKRPLLAFLAVAILSSPFLITYKGTLSYNSLDEIGDGYNSVKAFNLISDGFSAGEALPTQLILKHDEPLASMEGLVSIETLSQAILSLEEVSTVRSVSRPTGELLPQLQAAMEGQQQATEAANDSQTEDTGGGITPPDLFTSPEFQQILDTYMSQDRMMVSLDIILKPNPYSEEALASIKEIKAMIDQTLPNTVAAEAEYAIGGVTSIYADLNQISSDDYTRTSILMLIGIAIILIILFRSIVMTLYVIGSLVLTFYTAMGVSELIFIHALGYDGISWAVPFFAFVILIALGVDYSIFLMDRFNEYRDESVHDALIHAMKRMGTVILSAAVILGGTFAAMIPSGVLSLMQIATIVLAGLSLYSLLYLPFFIPVMVRLFGNANWWPFKRRQPDHAKPETETGKS